MRTFVRFLLRHRALASVALVLSLGASLYLARTLELRFQFRDFYDYPGNAALPLFKEYTEVFGDPANYVVVMIEADDVFRREVLQYVETLGKTLEKEPKFTRVRSLLTVNAIRGEGDEVLSGRLISKIPDTREELASLRQVTLQNPLIVRRLVSTDGTTTALLAQMRTPIAFSSIAEQEACLEAVRKALAATPPPRGLSASVTGAPGIEVGTTQALISDQLRLIPFVCLVLALMLFVTFRSLHGVLLCLTSVTVAFIWTAGMFATFKRPVDLTAAVIPVTLLVYGVVDPIFVLVRFREKMTAGLSKTEAIVESLGELTFPCLLTSTTTAIGFAAFVTCVAPSIRYYGLTVGIGVMLCFVTTITVLPLMLSIAPTPKSRAASGEALDSLGRWLGKVGNVTASRPTMSVLFACAALVLGTWLAKDQHLNNAYVDTLPNGTTRSDVRRLEDKLFGVARMSVYLEGAADTMKNPAVLQAMATVERKMERSASVTSASSLAGVVAEAHQAFQGGMPEERVVPSSRSLIGQYLTLIDPQDRADFVNDDFSRSHIVLSLKDRGSEETRALKRDLEQAVASANFQSLGVKAQITGHSVVAYGELDGVVMELVYGFITAFLIVIAFEWLTFRSWLLAALTIIPNLIPIMIGFMTARYLNIALRIDTVLMLCISIGGLFNTTIHFVARVLQQVDAGEQDPDEIIRSALRTIAPPSLFTALIIAIGFGVFLMSDFPGLQVLGLLCSVTVLAGFLCDFFFTPSFVRLGFKWQRVARLKSVRPMAPSAVPAE